MYLLSLRFIRILYRVTAILKLICNVTVGLSPIQTFTLIKNSHTYKHPAVVLTAALNSNELS